MTSYLLRRFIQMAFVVLLSSVAIYVLLNVAPGGPLSGLKLSADRRSRVSGADIARLEAYLGLDKPLFLRYITWLVGDDWLGADWIYLGLGGYRVDEEHTVRFWSDPGVAHIKPGYTLWVSGEEGAEGVIEATHVETRPEGERPDDVVEGDVTKVLGPTIMMEGVGGVHRYTVKTSPETVFVMPQVAERPREGRWLNISGLLGAHGLLGRWAGYHRDGQGVLRLDWGMSWKVATGQPVEMIIMSRLRNTLLLMSLALGLSLVVAIPIGVYSALKQYSRLDYAVTTFAFFGSAMPVFWFGLMMVLLFSYQFRTWGLPFMPAGGVISHRAPPTGSVLAALGVTPGGLLDRAVHLAMPALVLSLLYMAGWSRFMRSSMLEVLRQDYVRTARAKGLIERMVIAKHALRNALIPVITVVVLQIPGIFGGATLTETIFNYPGIGRLFFQSLVVSDWPIVMVLLFITAVLVVVSMLMGDILYTVVDPRIRFD